MPKCKDCKFLRTEEKMKINPHSVARKFGIISNPCNRFPMNILKHKNEPACGEFKAR